MSIFNHLYSFDAQKMDPHARIQIGFADSSVCAQAVRWGKWLVQLPIQIPHMAHTIYLMIKNQEMLAPLERQIIAGRSIHRIPTLRGQGWLGYQHVVTSVPLANEILKAYRSDENGLFFVEEHGDNALLFLPLIGDLVEKKVEREDFLFTCQSERAEIYRRAILEFVGPQHLPNLRERLKKIVDDAMTYLKAKEKEGIVKCSARELTGAFTVAVITSLLVGKEFADFEKYVPISRALVICIDHAMMKFVHMKPNSEQMKNYEESLQTLRTTINEAEGEFAERLNNPSMTEIQKKALLAILFIAGNDTTASLLDYLMWQLGRRLEDQKAICQEVGQDISCDSPILEGVIKEALRMNPPGALVGRTARKDLNIHVTNPDGSSWDYVVSKGDNILVSPYFTARTPGFCENPFHFEPKRKEFASFQNVSLPWNPFGRGAHSCPGKWLALEETRTFIKTVLSRYEVKSSPKTSPRQKLKGLTTSLDPHVTLTLKRKEGMAEESKA